MVRPPSPRAEPAVWDLGFVKAGDEPVPDAAMTVPAVDEGDGITCHAIRMYFLDRQTQQFFHNGTH
jgi:hypothetical protein